VKSFAGGLEFCPAWSRRASSTSSKNI
jgi:hypothetical protein